MIYTVTFNPAVDYIVRTDCMEIGSVCRSQKEEICFGGKGINVSLVLAQLGVPSKALGFVAGFTGEAIEKGIAAEGIETDFVHLDTGFSRINVKIKTEKETELNGRGPDIPAEKLEMLFKKLDAVRNGDTLVLAGSVPPSLPPDIYEQILHRLRERDIKAVVDAEKDLLLRTLPYKPFLIKPNHPELEQLFGVTLTGTDQIIACARRLQKMGAVHVLVSMAEKGAILLDGNGSIHICGVCKGTVKNSVGAGDSMVAGFLAGCKDGDYAHALKLGTAAGGAAAFSEGLAKRKDIVRLMKELN